jgi:hypothetical protein
MQVSGIRTIESQASKNALNNLTPARLSFKTVLAISKTTALKLNTRAIFTDYMYHLRNDQCSYIIFTEEKARRYMYKPKLLAYALYGSTDFYQLIMRLNHMKSVADFTMEKLMDGILVPYVSVKDFFGEVLIKEKLPINRNMVRVEEDVKLTQK